MDDQAEASADRAPREQSGQRPIPPGDDESEIQDQEGNLPGEVAELIQQAFAQVTSTGSVQVRVGIELGIDLNDVLIRDAVLANAVAQLDQPWLPLLIACATWTPDFLAAELCSVLSMVAYRHGDGALAQLAVDRCLAVEPNHPLAQLMIMIMAAGVRPEELERIATDQSVMDYFDQFDCDDYPDDESEDERYERDMEEAEFWWES